MEPTRDRMSEIVRHLLDEVYETVLGTFSQSEMKEFIQKLLGIAFLGTPPEY